MTAPLLRISNLTVTLGGHTILRDINAEVKRGAITALIGLNGSGKTTLLRAILKEIPYRGKIDFFCGHDHRQQRPEYVGYVPQKLRIDANLPLTVRDLLALALQKKPIFFGISTATENRMHRLLQRVFDKDSTEILNRPVESLSGGELQRVLMGLAMDPHPELLLLDEPAAGVDFRDQEKFYDLIARLNHETGVTVILVSHEVGMVSQHSHHVLCLKDGEIRCQGTPTEMMGKEMLQEIFGTSTIVFHHDHSDGHHPPR